MKFYIAYGLNMSMEQMRRRCPDAVLVGKGMLPEYHLLFKGSLTGAYATIEKDVDTPAGVPVVIFRISDRDERNLDRYEGYPKFYYKTELRVHEVQICDGYAIGGHGYRFRSSRDLTALVYIMHEERVLGVPPDFYFQQMLDSYAVFGIDPAQARAGLAYSRKYEGAVRWETGTESRR
jgi:hypothetical protein